MFIHSNTFKYLFFRRQHISSYHCHPTLWDMKVLIMLWYGLDQLITKSITPTENLFRLSYGMPLEPGIKQLSLFINVRNYQLS